jgi:hypothetical protein
VPESFRQQLVTFQWEKSEPLHALLCLPGVALPLLVGIHYGYPGTAALMVGGAQSVAFGSYQQRLFHRSGAMVYSTLGIGLSALVGALCRDSPVAMLLVALLWAFLYGMTNSISTAVGWVGQQCCLFLIVSSAAPSAPGTTHDLVYSALLRGAGVLAGGALQTLLLWSLRHWLPQAQTMFSTPEFDPTHFQRKFLRDQFTPRSAGFQFALRLMITTLIAVPIYRLQGWTSSYWIGMTALLIPKPEFDKTVLRGVLRTIGTILGAMLCTFIIVGLRPHGQALTGLVLVFLCLGYLTNEVHYGVYSLFVTGYICFVLAVAHQPAHEVLPHRVIATAIGASIALGVHAAFIGGRKLFGIATPTLQTMEERWHMLTHIPYLRHRYGVHDPCAHGVAATTDAAKDVAADA